MKNPLANSPQWRILTATARGSSHSDLARPNQDRAATNRVGNDGPWVYAVADGAGSRSRSDKGSLFAVDAATTAANQVFGRGTPTTLTDWRAAVVVFAKACLRAFDLQVDSHGAALKSFSDETADQMRASFATTLLAVVAKPPFFGYVSVGDCFLVVERDPGGAHLLVTAPEREHAGQTVFLTSANRVDHLMHGVVMDERIRGLALCTDGLVEGMLDIGQTPDGRMYHEAPPTFSVYFNRFSSPQVNERELEMKLQSPEFAETSSDDKTIVMAVRTT